MPHKDTRNLAFLLLLSAILYFFGLGSYAFIDPDEPFYAMTAKEMLQSGQWGTPLLFGRRLFEKPPLTYWLIEVFYKLFGVNEWAARLPMALAGTLTVLCTYFLAKILFKRSGAALLCSLILATGAEFIILSRTVLTDMIFTFFVTACFLFFYIFYLNPAKKWAALCFFASMAMGFLTKGPLGALIPAGGILFFLISGKQTGFVKRLPWLTGIPLFLALGGFWYFWMIKIHGTYFLHQFFVHENIRRFFSTEHEELDRMIYYPLVTLAGFFPWTFLFLLKPSGTAKRAMLFILSGIAFGFLFFILAKSKLPSYIFPLFPLIAIYLGVCFYKFKRSVAMGFRPKQFFSVLAALLIALGPVILLTAMLFVDRHKDFGYWNLWAAALVAIGPLFVLAGVLFYKAAFKKFIAVFLMAIACLNTFCFVGMMPRLQKYFSSIEAAASLKQELSDSPNSYTLASKLFVRGVYMYGGLRPDRIGVFTAVPDAAFYTRHPISILSQHEELAGIPDDEYPVYCVFRHKEVKLMRSRMRENLRLSLLYENAQWVLAKLEKAA